MSAEDPNWPRASNWLKVAGENTCDLALFGVPAHLTSISQTGANKTPAAIRAALSRYSLNSSLGDIGSLQAFDFGDVSEPDSSEGEDRTSALTTLALSKSKLAIALGGDNSITYSVARATLINGGGLITFDAHHDIRDGVSNGSPIRRLIQDSIVQGNKVVQIGINDFSNSPEYSRRAKDFGIHVITRSDIERRSPEDVIQEAFDVIGSGNIHVDFDVDVCDRAFVPACPASAPGGISAYQLREFARLVCSDDRVRSIDITEIDSTIDAEDERTIRLGALLILEAAAGLLRR